MLQISIKELGPEPEAPLVMQILEQDDSELPMNDLGTVMYVQDIRIARVAVPQIKYTGSHIMTIFLRGYDSHQNTIPTFLERKDEMILRAALLELSKSLDITLIINDAVLNTSLLDTSTAFWS